MRVELYHLKDDPGEKTDLAGQMPARVAKLHRRLHAWRDEVGAQMPAPSPNFTSENN